MNPVQSSPGGWRVLAAGAAGSMVSLAVVVALGVLAFTPLGTAGVPLGLAAALATALTAAALYALLAPSATPVGGPSSATAVVLAGLVMQVAQRHPGDPVPAAVAAAGAAVLGMGLVQLALAALRLGRLAGFVPQPVLSGFMNGVALLVMLAQVPAVLAIDREAWRADPLQAARALQPGAVLLALGVCAAVMWVARRRPRWPATLVGLAAGTLLYHGVHAVLPGAPLGPAFGLTAAPPPWSMAGAWWAPAVLADHGAAIALAAVVMALTSSLEGLLSQRALDQQTGERSKPDRVLMAIGAANVLGGLLGALPVTVVRGAATAMLHAGARGRAPAVVATLITALLLAGAGPALAWLPQAALAGVMLAIGAALADRWSHRLWRRGGGPLPPEARRSLAVVALVAAVTALAGTAAGVAVGCLVAMAGFVLGVRGSVLRSQYDGTRCPSRRVWPLAEEARLAPLRRHIAVLELQGALFFGSAQRVADLCETLPAEARFVVLDLRRVSTIDESGTAMLEQLHASLAQRGAVLLLAGVDAARAQRLAAFGTTAQGARWHPDADRAIEAAESALLAAQAAPAGSEPPAPALLPGLPAEAAAGLQLLMPLRTLAAGEVLFRHGDTGDALYAVVRGSVSIVSADRQHRFATCGPGTTFGEMALLDGGGRTADAVADEPTELRMLDRATLLRLEREQPALAVHLHRHLAVHLSQRMRVASVAWQAAAG